MRSIQIIRTLRPVTPNTIKNLIANTTSSCVFHTSNSSIQSGRKQYVSTIQYQQPISQILSTNNHFDNNCLAFSRQRNSSSSSQQSSSIQTQSKNDKVNNDSNKKTNTSSSNDNNNNDNNDKPTSDSKSLTPSNSTDINHKPSTNSNTDSTKNNSADRKQSSNNKDNSANNGKKSENKSNTATSNNSSSSSSSSNNSNNNTQKTGDKTLWNVEDVKIVYQTVPTDMVPFTALHKFVFEPIGESEFMEGASQALTQLLWKQHHEPEDWSDLESVVSPRVVKYLNSAPIAQEKYIPTHVEARIVGLRSHLSWTGVTLRIRLLFAIDIEPNSVVMSESKNKDTKSSSKAESNDKNSTEDHVEYENNDNHMRNFSSDSSNNVRALFADFIFERIRWNLTIPEFAPRLDYLTFIPVDLISAYVPPRNV